MPEVSVIVPVRDALSTLERTLRALSEQIFDGGFEVIVVDDGSKTDPAPVARRVDGDIRVVHQERLGPAAARNRGVQEASADLLAFCDADCFPTPYWLASGVRALDAADLVQGHVQPDPGARIGPFDRTLWITFEVGLYETANLFVRRATFERAGGFEEWLRPRVGKAIAEDVWFGWRARRTGATTAFCADALAHHAVFERRARDYVAERRRLRYFPAMVAQMPELRGHFLWRRWFLNRRTAALDAAVAGLAAATATRSPRALLLGAPYALLLVRHARRAGDRYAPRVGAIDLVADSVGLAELAHGSLRYRSPVL